MKKYFFKLMAPFLEGLKWSKENMLQYPEKNQRSLKRFGCWACQLSHKKIHVFIQTYFPFQDPHFNRGHRKHHFLFRFQTFQVAFGIASEQVFSLASLGNTQRLTPYFHCLVVISLLTCASILTPWHFLHGKVHGNSEIITWANSANTLAIYCAGKSNIGIKILLTKNKFLRWNMEDIYCIKS